VQITKALIKKYLLPGGLIIILFAAAAVLAVQSGIKAVSWKFYVLILIFLLIALFLALVFRWILEDEAGRQAVTGRIEEADEKYRSLLETSADGTLMIMDRQIAHANFVFLAMSGYTLQELAEMKFEDLIRGKEKNDLRLENLFRELGESGRTQVMEAGIHCKRGDIREVVLAVSKINLEGREGLLIISKDMSGRKRMEQESTNLRNELQSSILMMNLPIASFSKEYLSCDMDATIHAAALLMHRKNQNAIIVNKDGSNPVGILTDSDLRDRVIAKEKDYKDPVFEIMSSPLIRISDQALLYEGILQIKENDISHLVVEDRNGRITGIFSTEDLLEVQRNSISYLIREVNAAETVDSLKKIHNKIPVLVKILLESGARVRNITYMISTVTDAITQRLIGFAIEEMGEPPARFSFMALGSEGRREQTLLTDQDNAIIFEDVPNEKLSEVSRYFLYFGKKINLWLDRIGYQYCKGEVMAGNPQWCQPLSRWENYFSDWVGRKSDEGILGVAVFFDFRIVYGEEQFARELRQHINKTVSGKEAFFSSLAREVASYDIPVNIFKANGAETSPALPEAFNVKNALSPLTGFIRTYALHNRVAESNSIQRLDKLLRLNVIPESECQELENMYCLLMEIRFRSQVNAILANRAPDNTVGQHELIAIEQTMVQKAFSEIKRYQEMIVEVFGS
jgi:PAS domain S-box-containing protein